MALVPHPPTPDRGGPSPRGRSLAEGLRGLRDEEAELVRSVAPGPMRPAARRGSRGSNDFVMGLRATLHRMRRSSNDDSDAECGERDPKPKPLK